MRPDLIKKARQLQAEVLEYVENALGIDHKVLHRSTGVSRSSIRAWTCDTDSAFRHMPVVVLLQLARLRKDPIGVFQPLLDEFDLVAIRHHDAPDLEVEEVQIRAFLSSAKWGAFMGDVGQALADGELDSMERAELVEELEKHLGECQGLLAQLKDEPGLRALKP